MKKKLVTLMLSVACLSVIAEQNTPKDEYEAVEATETTETRCAGQCACGDACRCVDTACCRTKGCGECCDAAAEQECDENAEEQECVAQQCDAQDECDCSSACCS